MKRIYLATPYSSKWRIVRFWRFLWVSYMAMRLMKKNLVIYSPISHTAPISWFGPEQEHNFWLAQDWRWLVGCDELWVLKLRGWDKSYGVSREIEYAKNLSMPINYIDPKTFIIEKD